MILFSVKPLDKGAAQPTSPPANDEGGSTPSKMDFSSNLPQTGGEDATAIAPIAFENYGRATSEHEELPPRGKPGTGPGVTPTGEATGLLNAPSKALAIAGKDPD